MRSTPDQYSANEIYHTALAEIREEQFRKAVEAEKERLRATRWWHRFIPIITIEWRK